MFKYCSAPWNDITIELNGDVYFCQCQPWTTLGPIGNLLQNSLREIFTNAKANLLRDSIFDQSFRFCDKNTCGYIWNLEEVENLAHIKPATLPSMILLNGLVESCNLQCPQCRSGLNYSPKANPQVTKILNILLDAYQDYDGYVTFCADGSGEFFANEAYIDFLSSDKFTKKMFIEIYTNGTLLNKNYNLLKYRAHNIASLSVSLDAATPETYYKIRGHDLNQVISGITSALYLGIDIRVNMVVQKNNYHEILDFQQLCKDLGIENNNLSLIGVTKWSEQNPNWFDENKLRDNPEVSQQLLVDQCEQFEGNIDGNILQIVKDIKHNP